MSDEQPKILVFLDVLGFGSTFVRLKHRGTLALYESLLTFVDDQEGGLDVVPLPDGGIATGWFMPEHTYFSDTILFWTHYDQVRLFRMTELAAESVCKAVEIGLPVRGAIAIGEGTFNNESRRYFGAPLFEASDAEKVQRWIGISFGPSILTGDFGQGLYLNTVLPYKSHLKPGGGTAAPGLVVDWPRRWRETRREDLRETVRALDVDERFKEYYEQTLRFIEFSLKNHDWFEHSPHLDFG
jgi:hypothetical protein